MTLLSHLLNHQHEIDLTQPLLLQLQTACKHLNFQITEDDTHWTFTKYVPLPPAYEDYFKDEDITPLHYELLIKKEHKSIIIYRDWQDQLGVCMFWF